MSGPVLLDRPTGMKRLHGGVLLDAKGRPEFDAPFDKPGPLRVWTDVADADLDRLPDSVRWNLEKAAQRDAMSSPRNSLVTWEEVIYNPNADGPVLTAAANAIMVPDVSIPASYLVVGKTLKYTIMGRQSTAVTTPGTVQFILKWGGVGGTAIVTSGAFAPNTGAVATNLTWMLEFWVQCRSVGATGTVMAFGRVEWSDYNDASTATLKANLDMRMAPVSAPAVVTVDTTIDKLLSATYTPSLGTASLQTHVAILEACN